MPFYISPNVFKQQTKTLVKDWPFAGVTTGYVRNILSQLYGYKDSHQYTQLTKANTLSQQGLPHSCNPKTQTNAKSKAEQIGNQTGIKNSHILVPCSQATVIQHYTLWVQRLARLAPMNEIQAKKLIHKIWFGYLQHHVDTATKMYQCQFEFRGDCTIFLDKDLRDTTINYTFDDRPAIKDAIEALGVPHPEVLAIKVDDTFVDFTHKLTDGCQVTVYSTPDYLELINELQANNAPDTQGMIHLPYKPSKNITFLLDVHLGGLVRYLRMAGFDCLFETKDFGDAFLAEVAERDDLILLTRDVNLLKRSNVKYGRWIRNVLPEPQFHEVMQHYQLTEQIKPFGVCIKCNGHIAPVEKPLIEDKVPPYVYQTIDAFKQCQQCHQVYWQGTHYQKIKNILARAQGSRATQ